MPIRKKKISGYDIFAKFDRFADPVYLTINHQKKIKTPWGGLLSIVVAAIILAWFGD